MNKQQLFGLDKGGKFKVWSIWVEGDTIFIEHGKDGGKMQLKTETVKGKNIGRANETTGAQQAEAEAASRLLKQLDKGYRFDKESLKNLPILPMLAHDYGKQGHRIDYEQGCHVSAKMDGVRSLAIRWTDKVELKSRGGKSYNIPHIEAELMQVMLPGDIWDGELYIHGKYLEEIVSATKKPNDLTKELTFRIFDVVSGDQVFEDRLKELYRIDILISDMQLYSVSTLPYEFVTSEAEMKEWHSMYVAMGYEGVMIRNRNGLYEAGKRSGDLQKYKQMLDEEFQIVAVGGDRNNNAVLKVFDPVSGENFDVCYGNFEQRKDQLANWENYVGKFLTVQYQTRYKDSKLPQFPCGVRIRDCDEHGNPLE